MSEPLARPGLCNEACAVPAAARSAGVSVAFAVLAATEVQAAKQAQVDTTRDVARSTQPNAAKSPRFYQPELDALRFIAFLMVFISHCLPTPADLASHGLSRAAVEVVSAIKDAGNFGVCVFFLLSAYLITELLRRERLATGSIHLRAFYLRRVLRIWPLYLGVLAAYGLLGMRFHGFHIEPMRLLASLLMAGNWYIAFHPAILTPMRALWSISVEEQFYLTWPLLARHATRRFLMAACAALLTGSALTLVVLAAFASQATLHITAWVNSFVQFQYFAFGALAAILLGGRVPRLGIRLRVAAAVVAGALMLVSAGVCQIKRAPLPSSAASRDASPIGAAVWNHPAVVHARLNHAGVAHGPGSLVIGYMLAGLATVALFFAVLGTAESAVPRVLVHLGKISFGLYVFHETGFFLADTLARHIPSLSTWSSAHWVSSLALNKVLSLAITIALASLSYRFWEKPFLTLKDRFTFVRSRAA